MPDADSDPTWPDFKRGFAWGVLAGFQIGGAVAVLLFLILAR